MAYRQTRNAVRTSKPAQQQHLSRSFVSGGSVHPNNVPPPVVQQPPAQPAQPPAQPAQPPNSGWSGANMNVGDPRSVETLPYDDRRSVKPEPNDKKDADGDVSMAAADSPIDLEQFKEEKRRFFLKLKKASGGVDKRNKRRMIQRKLRKHVAPKNATMALQEVRPGVMYKIIPVPGSAPPMFTAEVEVDGKLYQGVGSNKSLARATAAERALQSFVPPPPPPKDAAATAAAAEAEGNDSAAEAPEDETPWSALASFALHRLFCDWRQGRVGAPLSLEAAGPPLGAETTASAGQTAASAGETAAPATTAPGPAAAKNNSAAGTDGAAKVVKPPPKPKAPKVLPPDAVSRHPVMLLHEMRTSVVFEMTEYNKPTAAAQEHSYTMTVTVDGREFKATARGKKEAKRLAAKEANVALFGLQYPTEME